MYYSEHENTGPNKGEALTSGENYGIS
jgi:hypothetical protein